MTASSTPTLDDLLKDIPPSLLDQQCSDVCLTEISRRITKWQLLRPYLKLTPAHEDTILQTYHYSGELQKQKLLEKWREIFSTKATYRVLIEAIFDSGNADVAHDACELLRQQSSQNTASECCITDLSPCLVKYQCQLKSGYKTHKPVMVVEWPPPPALKYISLALIQKETVQKGYIKDEFIRMTIHGNLDDILYQKVPIEVEQLFSLDAEKQTLILIEGAPGSGKSTLLWHICQKWQSGELFQQFSLVLLVLLRDTAVHNAQCLADVLPHLPSRTSKSSEIRANIASEIEDTHGKGVLIMLDGWDEAPAKLREEGSLFHDIISDPVQCSLEEAVVVVSSRPAASHDLWKYATSRVEVLGFTKERREEYIQESLKNDPQHVKVLIHRIESVPELGCSCHLPLNLVIVTHTFICSGNKLPSTYCQVIVTLALSCLVRHIRKEKSSVTVLKSLNTLPKNIDDGFMKLCKIAYEGIVKEKYSFSVHDLTGLPEHESVLESNIPTLGLLQSVHSLVATGSSIVYHFLHLSLQELCAAHYIASLPDPESTHIEALKAMVLEKSSRFDFGAHFQPVCDFYSALTHLKNPEVVDQLMRMYELENRDNLHLVRPLKSQSGRLYANYLFLKCLGQSENSELVNKIIGKCVEVRVTSISRQAVASVIALASDLESLTSTGYFPELSQALSGNINMKKLVINDISTEVIQELILCPNLEHLVIGSYLSWSGDTEISCLSDIINQMSLRVLHINGIQGAGLITLSSSLATNATIKELVIDCSNVSAHSREVFARALANNTSLIQKGDFMLNKALAIQTCLDFKSDTSVAYVNLPDILSSFSTLDISGCAISIVQLSCALQTNTSIKHLTICCEKVRRSGQQALTKALLHNSSLTTLRLKVANNPFIGDDQMFFNCLRYTKSLTEFHMCPYEYESYPCLSGTSVGRALLSGDLVELADILGLNTPPTVDKTLHIYEGEHVHIAVDFNNSCFNQLEVTKAWISRMGSHSRAADDSMDPIEELSDLLNKSSLKEIDISKCRMGDAGLMLLSSALTRNNTIQHLKFNCEEISPRGQTSLAEGLSHNSSLVTLELIVHTHPFLDNDQAFFRSLKQAKSLTEIKLLYNTMYVRTRPDKPCLIDTSIGRALLSGNLVKVADILGLNTPHQPTVEKTLDIHIYENACMQVDFKKRCFISIGLTVCEHSGMPCKAKKVKCSIESIQMEELSATLQDIQVKKLNLSTNGLGNEGAIYLGKGISKTMCLEELIIHNCGIGEEGIASLLSGLTSNTTLIRLDVSSNSFGDNSAIRLAEVINETAIQTLDISSCDVEEQGIVALALALRANTTLKKLNLYSLNKITQRSELELARALLHNTTLISLCINQNPKFIPHPFHDSCGIHTFRVTHTSMLTLLRDTSTCLFNAGIKNSPIIDSIETDSTTSLGQALWAGNMEEAAEILQLHQPPLRHKTLTIHNIGSDKKWTVDYQTKSILEGNNELVKFQTIYSNPKFWKQPKSLNLQHTTLGSVGVTLLVEVVNKTQLQELNISRCGIGREGIESLCSGLTSNTTLVKLDMSWNSFGDNGAIRLAEMINQTTIQTLDISSCGVEEQGIVALALALTANTTLKKLNIYSLNKITHSELELARALLHNTTLISLCVNQNPKFIPHPFHYNCAIHTFRVTRTSMLTLLRDTSTCLFYAGIKNSPIISHIEIDSTTSLGQALWTGNMEEATEILQLHQPPVVGKTLTIHMSGNMWTVNYRTKYLLERDRGLVRVRSICNNPESWSQLTKLKLRFKGSVGACILAKTLNKMQLQKLEIHDSGEEEEGIVAICQALSGNTTLKSLVLYSSVGPGHPISGRSEEALVRALLKNTTLTSLHVNNLSYERNGFHFNPSTLKDISENELYSGIKQSPIVHVAHIETDSTTSLGQALWAGNMEEAAEILQLHQPPVVGKRLTIHMSGNTWTVYYRTKRVLECVKELVRVRSICNNPESWSQLKELKLHLEGSVGACILAKTLNKMQLQKLEINDSGEEEEGIVAICQALSGNTTLKSLILHSSVGPRYPISGRSEEALVRALLKNTTLTSLHVNYSKYEEKTFHFNLSTLKDVSENELYSGIKQSPIVHVAHIEIDSSTSLGQALWTGNMEEATEILQLHQPPVVDKILTIHMSGNTWTVYYRTKCVLEDDKELVRVRSICNNPESWSQLKELKLHLEGSVGACILAKTLNKMQLQKLEINDSCEEEEGTVAICQALSGNTTLKSLILHSSVDPGYPISGRSEEALTKSLLINTTLISLRVNHWNYKMKCITIKLILKDVCEIEIYSGVKQSPIIDSIEIDSTTSLGQALWAGNMEEAAEILQLHQPPVVDKTLTIHMSGNTWTVNYRTKCVLEDGKNNFMLLPPPLAFDLLDSD